MTSCAGRAPDAGPALLTLADRLLDLTARVTGFESAFLSVIDWHAPLQRVVATLNVGALDVPVDAAAAWSDTLCSRVLGSGARLTPDARRSHPDCEAAKALGIVGFVTIPIVRTDGSIFGTICAASSEERTATPDAVQVMETLAEMISLHLDREDARAELAARAAELKERSLRDPLTGLPNRVRLLEQLDAIGEAEPVGSTALLFIDLDHFKNINDERGHAFGDRVLVEVADRLRRHTRPSDTVARLSGDEFALLLTGIRDHDEARMIAARVLTELRAPLAVEGVTVTLGASVGLAFRQQYTVDGRTLLQHADMAMYAAKRDGRGRCREFDDGVHALVAGRAELEGDLRRALDAGQFQLVYQPIVSLDDGHVEGMEALIRWNHPRRGSVSPAEFIGLAEESGEIVAIGRWVLDEACAQTAAWNLVNPDRPRYVSVNVSPRQLTEDLAVAVTSALAYAGLRADQLVIEITENVFAAGPDALRHLADVRGLGVRVAIDDFGTGYSSLSYLRQLPADIVKIDRSFVHPAQPGPEDEAIVEAIVRLCGTLGLAVIAEGVETAQEAESLRRIGVRRGQGYHFAKPAPLGLQAPPPTVQPIAQGPVAVAGAPSANHICLGFRGHSRFLDAALAFLADGARRQERLLYIADALESELLEDLRPLGDVEGLVRDGVLAVHSLRTLYTPGSVLDGPRQVETYRQLTIAAIEAGFRGLRVAADATFLVRDRQWRSEFLSYELAVNTVMDEVPMRAMCAYNVDVLGDAAAELACVHPAASGETPPGFRLVRERDGFVLEGTVTEADRLTFRRVLQAAASLAGTRGLMLDVGRLWHIDPSALAEMLRVSQEGRSITIQGATPALADAFGDRLPIR